MKKDGALSYDSGKPEMHHIHPLVWQHNIKGRVSDEICKLNNAVDDFFYYHNSEPLLEAWRSISPDLFLSVIKVLEYGSKKYTKVLWEKINQKELVQIVQLGSTMPNRCAFLVIKNNGDKGQTLRSKTANTISATGKRILPGLQSSKRKDIDDEVLKRLNLTNDIILNYIRSAQATCQLNKNSELETIKKSIIVTIKKCCDKKTKKDVKNISKILAIKENVETNICVANMGLITTSGMQFLKSKAVDALYAANPQTYTLITKRELNLSEEFFVVDATTDWDGLMTILKECKERWNILLDPNDYIQSGDLNYAKGMKYSRSLNSFRRHVWKLVNGQEIDDESLLRHEGHICCNAMFLVTYILTSAGIDDRVVLEK